VITPKYKPFSNEAFDTIRQFNSPSDDTLFLVIFKKLVSHLLMIAVLVSYPVRCIARKAINILPMLIGLSRVFIDTLHYFVR
jgi:hypothetical protein